MEWDENGPDERDVTLLAAIMMYAYTGAYVVDDKDQQRAIAKHCIESADTFCEVWRELKVKPEAELVNPGESKEEETGS